MVNAAPIEINARRAQVVELRFFGGMTDRKAAGIPDVSLAIVERGWQPVRLWLDQRLSP